MKKTLLSLFIAGSVAFAANAHDGHNQALATYAKIADANYEAALNDAKALQSAINAFSANPTQESLDAVKSAWLHSRESYGTTEIFRLSNGPIDAEEGWVAEAYGNLEAQINAWPLDENMIDYTIDANGQKTKNNIIDTVGEFTPGGEDAKPVNVSAITAEALTELNEDGGEANVSTGFHAIEFLVWGQDQDYASFIKDGVTQGAMVAGQRPLSDFTTDALANRRLGYLQSAANKLVADLQTVSDAWDAKVDGNSGLYRAALTGEAGDKSIPENTAVQQILGGMGTFIKSELANERIAVAVLTPSEEDEHSCFSDNTHRDIVTNFEGFKNALYGTYQGKKIGDSFFDKVGDAEKAKINELVKTIDEQVEKMNTIATTEAHFDHQIFPDSKYAKNIVSMKNNMRKLGDQMVEVAKANGVSLTEADVTDPEETKIN